ncbi:MAG: hypothetical protein ACRDHL_10315 [Candidatus Promineifilaceae bacterium]
MDMNVHLQQAIAAARAGKKGQAAMLVNRVLEVEPANIYAWFLRSVVADSEAEQVEALQRVLEIDPNHEVALKRLAQLGVSPAAATAEPPAWAVDMTEEEFEEVPDAAELEMEPDGEPMPVSNSYNFDAQAAADTIPEWLAEEDNGQTERAMPLAAEPMAAEPAAEADELPDWLQEELADDWMAEDETEVAEMEAELEEQEDTLRIELAQEEPDTPAPRTLDEMATAELRPARRRRMGGLEIVLVLMVILALVVLAALLYLVFSPPF